MQVGREKTTPSESDDKEKSKNGEEETQENKPTISPRRRAIYVGVVWIFWICSLYTLIFVSWFGFLLPLTVAQLLYVFWIRKNKLAVLPYQRQLMAWVQTTRIYDMFVCRVNGNRYLDPYRRFGLYFLMVGLIPLVVVFTDPTLDLDEMVVVQGTYESYKTVGRKNPCGDLLLTFRLEDSTPVQFWDTWGRNKSNLRELEQTKGEILTVWGRPKTTSMVPECRKYSSVAQIQSEGYQRLYDKKRSEKANRIFLNASEFLMTCGGLCLLRIVWVNRKKKQIISKEGHITGDKNGNITNK
jgi:hypothetical protein